MSQLLLSTFDSTRLYPSNTDALVGSKTLPEKIGAQHQIRNDISKAS